MSHCRLVVLGVMVGLSGLAAPAMAQVPVIDATSVAQLVQQLAEAKQQYQELVSQYQELKSTYQAVSQNVNPNQWAQQLEQPLMQNSVPNTSLLPGMLDGISPPSQLGGNLGSLAQQYLGQNQVYTPTGNDFAATQIQQGENSTADMEAVATQNLQSLEAREAELPQIQDQLNNATTIQQVSSIQARLNAEQNYVQAQQAQAQNLQLLAYEQNQQQQQATAEENRQSADTTISALCSGMQSQGESSPLCP